jgi:hypothetical protein
MTSMTNLVNASNVVLNEDYGQRRTNFGYWRPQTTGQTDIECLKGSGRVMRRNNGETCYNTTTVFYSTSITCEQASKQASGHDLPWEKRRMSVRVYKSCVVFDGKTMAYGGKHAYKEGRIESRLCRA